MVDETPLVIKFLTAGTSGCIADFATFPLDTAKVRLQIQGEGRVGVHDAVKACVSEGAVSLGAGHPAPHYRGLLGTMLTVAKEEGSRALYNGLSAGLQRQMCFASVRLGLYDSVKALYQPIFDGTGKGAGVAGGAGVCTRVAAGLTTGALAVLVAHPTDVVKVRFQAQTRIPGRPDTRRYKTTIQAYRHIAKETGVRGLWTGLLPNISRNAIINVAEIVCYDIVKDAIISRRLMDDSVPCHVSAAIVAGFSATVVASPVDVVKTRYMNAATGQYSGALHCAVTMARKEGAAAFYKGFAPSFCRLVSWNICMWLTYEQMKKAIASVRLPSPRPHSHVDVDVAVVPNAQAH